MVNVKDIEEGNITELGNWFGDSVTTEVSRLVDHVNKDKID